MIAEACPVAMPPVVSAAPTSPVVRIRDPRRITLDLSDCNVRQHRYICTLIELLMHDSGRYFREVLEGRVALTVADDGECTVTDLFDGRPL